MFLFEKSKGECYPDFYNKEKRIVLDAKYKGYVDWGKVQNPNIYQVISYMHILKANKGGFLVPKEGERQTPRHLVGNGGMMTIIGMPVNYASDSFEGYRGYMEKQQKQLIGQLQEYIEQY